jgi:hypothetical protein
MFCIPLQDKVKRKLLVQRFVRKRTGPEDDLQFMRTVKVGLESFPQPMRGTPSMLMNMGRLITFIKRRDLSKSPFRHSRSGAANDSALSSYLLDEIACLVGHLSICVTTFTFVLVEQAGRSADRTLHFFEPLHQNSTALAIKRNCCTSRFHSFPKKTRCLLPSSR